VLSGEGRRGLRAGGPETRGKVVWTSKGKGDGGGFGICVNFDVGMTFGFGVAE
jgi:hypothetical protein